MRYRRFNMCADRALPGWLYIATSDLWTAGLAPFPQKELALVFGYKQLRAEYEAEGVSGAKAELKAAKALGFYPDERKRPCRARCGNIAPEAHTLPQEAAQTRQPVIGYPK